MNIELAKKNTRKSNKQNEREYIWPYALMQGEEEGLYIWIYPSPSKILQLTHHEAQFSLSIGYCLFRLNPQVNPMIHSQLKVKKGPIALLSTPTKSYLTAKSSSWIQLSF